MIWTNDTISRFVEEAQQELANELKLFTKRISLSIERGQPIYTLPDDIIEIRRVTWKGYKIYPTEFRGIVDYQMTAPTTRAGAFSTAFSSAFQITATTGITPIGEPKEYFYSGFGENTIRFYPAPHLQLASVSTNLWGTEIPNRCIVEYYALPSTEFQCPSWMCRRLIRDFVCAKVFELETKGQNLDAAAFFKQEYQQRLEIHRVAFQKLWQAIPTGLEEVELNRNALKRPALPSKYRWF